MNEDYSQAGQDKFVLSLIKNNNQNTFVDIGCWLPKRLNNTLMMEEAGWRGVSLDITDLRKEWEIRNTPFILGDALEINYTELFNNHKLPDVIDYLNIDIEGNGSRFKVLEKVFQSGRSFKIITIEHDSYRGYTQTETIPQRNFLSSMGYELVCEDVCLGGNPFDDWWVNPKYIDKNDYKHLISKKLDYSQIMEKLK